MIFLLAAHALITAGSTAAVFWLVGSLAAISFLAGSALMLGNLFVLCLVWPLILRKKQVALSIGVIVFKFAILVWIISIVATHESPHRLQVLWFALGLSTVVLSSLATAVKYRDN